MSHYVVPRSTYFVVFALLIALLLVTVAASWYDFGHHVGVPGLNVAVALAIAVAKAALIILFFMQVKYASPLQRCFVVSGFLFLTILFAILFSDYLVRGPWDELPDHGPAQLGDPVEPGEAAHE
jgi:cytochrome c oxidase subunit 4